MHKGVLLLTKGKKTRLHLSILTEPPAESICLWCLLLHLLLLPFIIEKKREKTALVYISQLFNNSLLAFRMAESLFASVHTVFNWKRSTLTVRSSTPPEVISSCIFLVTIQIFTVTVDHRKKHRKKSCTFCCRASTFCWK